MMKKEENPGLFKAICNDLNKWHYSDLDYETTDELTDEQLAKVDWLVLDIDENTDVRSLNSIEKLPNLRLFSIYGARASSKKVQDIYNSECYEGKADDLKSCYYYENQVDDFSPLYNCKYLENLIIFNQRQNIYNLDLAKLTQLKKLSIGDCPNLRSISNVSEPIKNGALTKLEIIDCHKFNIVTDIVSVIESMENGYPLQCTLPINSYFPMVNQNAELRDSLKDVSSEQLIWNERVNSYNSQEMLMAHERIADIVNTVCQEGEDGLTKLSRIYRYFCDTAKYSPDDSEEYKDTNRKALSILFDKSAVCVGIAGAFNLCGQYLGYNMEECHCMVKRSQDPYYHEMCVLCSNHDVSKLNIIDSDTGQRMEYYFDLTWDLQEKIKILFIK